MLSAPALAADTVERVAVYSPDLHDQSVAYADDKVPTLFHFYTDDQPDVSKSRADAPHVYGRIDVVFKDGDLVPSTLVPLKAEDISSQFSDVDESVGGAQEQASKAPKVYTFLKSIKIGDEATIDVTVQPSGETQVMSHLIVHHKGRTESFDYDSVIRRVFPIPVAGGKNYIGVIADSCGNGGCTSTIEVLRFVTDKKK